MSHRLPISVDGAQEIKDLALRFSKSLQAVSGLRIRGRKLYDAFAKSLGYDSFNAILHASIHCSKRVSLSDYLVECRRTLKKHLLLTIGNDILESSLNMAADPGFVVLTVDCRFAPGHSVTTLIRSVFYQSFRERALLQGRRRNLSFVELLSPWFSSGPPVIKITLDYRNWPNESDPLLQWHDLKSFLMMCSHNANSLNGVDIEIFRLRSDGACDRLKRYSECGVFEWCLHDLLSVRISGEDAFTQRHDDGDGPYGNRIYYDNPTSGNNAFVVQQVELFRSNQRYTDTLPYHVSPTINACSYQTSLEIMSVIRANYLYSLSDIMTFNERIIFEMVVKTFSYLIDDYRTHYGIQFELDIFKSWIKTFPHLVNETWLSHPSRASLSLILNESQWLDVIDKMVQVDVQ